MTVWVTRSAPDNLWTARRLRSAGHDPLLAPVSEIVPLVHQALDSTPDLIIFSSIHAVRHHRMTPMLAMTPVYTCGDLIAEAAIAAGYQTATSLGNSESLLLDFITSTRSVGTSIAFFCSDYTSTRLETALSVAGMAVARRAVYQAQVTADAGVVAATQALPRTNRILVHSAPGAERLRPLLNNSGWSGTIYCISEVSAAVLTGLPAVRLVVAKQPSEEALLSALGPAAACPPDLSTQKRNAGAAALLGKLANRARKAPSAANDNN